MGLVLVTAALAIAALIGVLAYAMASGAWSPGTATCAMSFTSSGRATRGVSRLWATHPPLNERLARPERMERERQG